MDDKKVLIISMTDGVVGLTYPELHFHREWPKRGSKVLMDKDILREAIYSEGVLALFTEGMLYMEDMEFKKELGLEPEEADTPQEIIPLDEKLMKRMLTVMPKIEFREKFIELSEAQKIDLAEYAIENEIVNIDKANIIKEVTGINVMTAITNARSMEE